MIDQRPAAAPEGILARVPKTSGRPTREDLIYKRLSEFCLSLPGTTEKISWGHPNYRAGGRTFATLESFKGVISIAVRTPDEQRDLLLADPRFFPTPYSGGKGWVSLRMEGRTSWTLVKELCRHAHALVTEPARPATRKRRD